MASSSLVERLWNTATESEPSPHGRSAGWLPGRPSACCSSQPRTVLRQVSRSGTALIGSAAEDGAGADAGRAVDMGEADPGVARHLAVAGRAPELGHDLVDLPEPRCADRFAVGQAAAVGVDRQDATDLGHAPRQPLLLLA